MRTFPLRFAQLVYAVALVVRLIPIVFTLDIGIGYDDMFQYDMLARSLASGNGFRWLQPDDLNLFFSALSAFVDIDMSSLPADPRGIVTTFRAPLYPAFLAVIYRLFGLGRRFVAARVAHAFLTASLAPLTYRLAGRLGASEAHSRLGAFVSALWPTLIFYPLGLLTENLFMPLLAAALLALFVALRQERDRDFVLAGGLFGLATLTRSVIAGFPFLAAAWLWRRGQRRPAIVLAGMVLALTLPWAARNSLLNGRPTFVETSPGYNLYLGYHPQGNGSFQFDIALDLVAVLDDAERDSLGRQMAWSFIRDDPPRAAWLVVRKLGHLWSLEDRAFVYIYSLGVLGEWPLWAVAGALLILISPLVLTLPLSVIGLAFGERSPPWWLSAILVAYYMAAHAAIMAEERFHLALVPLLAALAARGLTLWPGIRRDLAAHRGKSRRLASIVGLVLLLLAFIWGLELAGYPAQLAQMVGQGDSDVFISY